MLRAVWRPVSIALLVTGVLLAYPVWMTIAGPLHITGPPFPTVNPYHNDLFSFVVPGPQQKISFGDAVARDSPGRGEQARTRPTATSVFRS